MNLFTKQKQTHRHRKQFMVTKGGVIYVWRINRYTLHICKIDKQGSTGVQKLYAVSYNNL